MKIKCYHNKNLKLSHEKLAAKTAHAVAGLIEMKGLEYTREFKVVVLQASKAKFDLYKNDHDCYVQIDGGLTEIPEGTETVLAFIEEIK